MPVLVGRFPMRVHMLMNQVYLEQQFRVSQDYVRRADCFDPVVLGQESDPSMQLVNQSQIVRGNH